MNSLFTIQEVVRQTGVSAHALRYYEKAGLLRDVGRHPNGWRFYTRSNIEWINILMILRSTGMSIRKIRSLDALRRQGAQSIAARIEFFTAYRQDIVAQIHARRRAVKVIDVKIARHQRMLEQLKIKERK